MIAPIVAMCCLFEPQPLTVSEPVALPSIEEVVGRVKAKLEQLTTLKFEADIKHSFSDNSGQWQGHHYRVVMEWTRTGTSSTRVYDLDQANKEIARYVDGEKVEQAEEAEGCLFGSLQQNWLGERSNKSPHAGPNRLTDTRVDRIEIVGGRACYVLVRQDVKGNVQYRGRDHWARHTYFVDKEDTLLRAWRTEYRLGDEWETAEVWRTVVEQFYYFRQTIEDRSKTDDEKSSTEKVGSDAGGDDVSRAGSVGGG